MTIRSLSLNLALVLSGEIVPRWHLLPRALKGKQFNVFVVPWPFEIPNGSIHECGPNPNEMDNMPPQFGFFTFDPAGGEGPTPHVRKLLDSKALKKERIAAPL